MTAVLPCHLREASRAARNKIIGQVHEKWFIADGWPSAQHRVAEPKRLSLSYVNARNIGRHDTADGLE
jgi:hypothetical protein